MRSDGENNGDWGLDANVAVMARRIIVSSSSGADACGTADISFPSR
jgi:hypothetical protein